MKSFSSEEISAGGAKVLRAFTQYPARVLEQCIHTQYSPFLNRGSHNIIFYNFKYSSIDMEISSRYLNRYQALGPDMITVLAESDSFNSLGKYIGLSNVTIRNNMDWHQGTLFVFEGQVVEGYLRQFGQPWRTELLPGQQSPRLKWPQLDLIDRTLYDLEPGKLHAITVDDLTNYGRAYNNERDLWTSLNPSSATDLDLLTSQQQHQYLNNRVGRYLNIARPEGNETELGNFYFARNPDHLAGFAKSAEPLFGINVDTGVASLYPNNSQVPTHNRLTVRLNLNNYTITRDGTIFITADSFLDQFPTASALPGSTYNMTLAELASLPIPSNINNIDALFSITLAGLATWHRNKSNVPNVQRHKVRKCMATNTPTSTGLRFIQASSFLELFPKATAGPGSTYQLTNEELKRIS